MKKVAKIFLLVVVSIVILISIFGGVDYVLAKKDKKPIFIFHTEDTYSKETQIGTKYYGLGYSIFICKTYCSDPVIFMPLYFGTYAWFIGVQDGLEVIKTENCDNKAELYYTQENKNIYSYCLDNIVVNKNSETQKLIEYIEKDSNAINYIINNYTKESKGSYDDGGSKLYLGEDFNILKCHTLSGNEDIYIGTKDMGYFNSFCN